MFHGNLIAVLLGNTFLNKSRHFCQEVLFLEVKERHGCNVAHRLWVSKGFG